MIVHVNECSCVEAYCRLLIVTSYSPGVFILLRFYLFINLRVRLREGGKRSVAAVCVIVATWKKLRTKYSNNDSSNISQHRSIRKNVFYVFAQKQISLPRTFTFLISYSAVLVNYYTDFELLRCVYSECWLYAYLITVLTFANLLISWNL